MDAKLKEVLTKYETQITDLQQSINEKDNEINLLSYALKGISTELNLISAVKPPTTHKSKP